MDCSDSANAIRPASSKVLFWVTITARPSSCTHHTAFGRAGRYCDQRRQHGYRCAPASALMGILMMYAASLGALFHVHTPTLPFGAEVSVDVATQTVSRMDADPVRSVPASVIQPPSVGFTTRLNGGKPASGSGKRFGDKCPAEKHGVRHD